MQNLNNFKTLATLLHKGKEAPSVELVSKMDIYLQFKFDSGNSWQKGVGASELKTSPCFSSILSCNCVYTWVKYSKTGEKNGLFPKEKIASPCTNVCSYGMLKLQLPKVIFFYIHLDLSAKFAPHRALVHLFTGLVMAGDEK